MRILLSFILFMYSICSFSQDFEWVKSVGGGSLDRGNSIITDNDGNVLVAGVFVGTADFDPGTGIENRTSSGSGDIFILKLDANGDFLWVKTIGGLTSDAPNSIDIDGDNNIHVLGFFSGTVDFDPGPGALNLTSNGSSDIFVLKLNSIGDLVWCKSFGGVETDDGREVVVDDLGNSYVTGIFRSTVDLNPGVAVENYTSNGGDDIFIQKLDSFGNSLWIKTFGGTSSDQSYSICLDGFSNIYTTGYFLHTVDFDPTLLVDNHLSIGGNDAFIHKMDSDGNYLWTKTFGGSGTDRGTAVTTDLSGNVIVGGDFQATVDFDPGPSVMMFSSAGNYDCFVQKLDSDGEFIWCNSFGGLSGDGLISIFTDTDENIYSSGFFRESVDFDPGVFSSILVSAGISDAFFQKVDSDGDFVWSQRIGSTTSEVPRSSSIDGLGNIYSTGNFSTTVDFDHTLAVYNLSPVGSSDAFIHKMSQCDGSSIDASFSYGSSSYCLGSSDPTPAITGVSGGTFSSTPSGLSINTTTGEIDIDASTENTYTITYTTAGSCFNTSTFDLTIGDTEDPVIAGCPSDISVTADASGCTSVVTWTAPTATDNCVTPTLVSSHASGSSFSVGTTTVTYTATDGAGNSSTCEFDVTVTNNLSATVSSVDDPLCFGGSDGQIFIDVSGGTGPYTFDWDHDGTGDFDDDEDQAGLDDGTYNVTVEDANGCQATTSGSLTEPTALSITIDSEVDPTGCGVEDGSISITVSGGTSDYTYDWDNDGTGDFDDMEDLSSLGAGTYNLEVMDDNGCLLASSVNLSDPSGPMITLDGTVDNVCFGEALGEITTTITGGTLPYGIDWDDDGTGDSDDSDDISGLEAGTYNLEVEDAAGCVASLSVDILESSEILIAEAASICSNDSLFLEDSYQTMAGIYRDTLTSILGCDSIIETTLYLNPVYEASLPVITICEGDSVMIFGVYESSAGLYYDSLTTVLGCDSVEIQELIINTVDVSTTTSSNEITAVSSGPGISYQWIDCADDSEIVGETDQIYLATSDGNYAVVIDDNSCVDTSACVLIQGIGIDQGINDLEIKIYPNPSSGVFNIKVDAGLIENVVIYNTAGVEVEKVYNITQSSYNIDLSEYEDGVYLLKIITSSNQVITRLIIKK